MKTYQIGNKVTCIIRSYCACNIGPVEMVYDNQPYTILKDVSVSLSFSDAEKNAVSNQRNRELYFDVSHLNQVKVSNVHLTNKVLQMFFQEQPEALRSHFESVATDENGKCYLSTSADTIYQVFVYNSDEELEYAYGEKNPNEIELEPNSNYLIVYQTLAQKALNLNSNPNTYYTLDLICEGNTDDATAPTYIHINKVGIKVEKSLYFNTTINAADITFNVINSKKDYIVLE